MRIIIVFMVVSALFSGSAFAGREYDDCLKQEETLRTQEKRNCSGAYYIFNPSGCFATKRLLKEYDKGKCRKIMPTALYLPPKEGTVQNIPAPAPAPVVKPETPPTQIPVEEKKPVLDKSKKQVDDTEKLKEENARMKAENERLKSEMEQLRKSVGK